MWGVIVASRPCITSFETISETQFAFSIPSQPPFSHLVVFILPGQQLPPGTAATVYIQIPPSSDFKLLGAIGNEKQSAIFKVNAAAAAGGAGTPVDDLMTDDPGAQIGNDGPPIGGPNIVVGISVEPVQSVQQQLANLKSPTPQTPAVQPSALGNEIVKFQQPQQQQQQQQQPAQVKLLAQRVIKNAFNFLSSFATGSGGNETVPLKAFNEWWSKFEKRLDLDPSFLEKDEQ